MRRWVTFTVLNVPRVTEWSIQHQENHKYPRKHREGTLLRDLRGLVMKWKRYEKLPAQNDALLGMHISHEAKRRI